MPKFYVTSNIEAPSWVVAASVTDALRIAAGLPKAKVGHESSGNIVKAWLGEYMVYGRRENVVKGE